MKLQSLLVVIFIQYGPVQDIAVRKNKAMISFTSAHDAVSVL